MSVRCAKRLRERGTARHIQLDAKLVVEHGRERSLAEAGGTIEENMGQRFITLAGCGKRHGESFGDLALPDHLVKFLGTKLLVPRIDGPGTRPRDIVASFRERVVGRSGNARVQQDLHQVTMG